MLQMSNYIKKLEAYGEDLEANIIKTTKINKVLKALIKLNTIPKDEEYNFRKRSVELLGKWSKILGAEPPDAAFGSAEKEEKSEPTTNGVHEKKGDDVEEPADKVAQPEEAVEKVSGEVDADAAAKAEVIETLQQDAEAEEAEVTKAAAPSEPVKLDQAPQSAEAAEEVKDVVMAEE